MKKVFAILTLTLTMLSLSAQNVYWVFLTDKAGTTFDPYTYFDAKAIERYNQCGADLYDQSNYPLNTEYVGGVDALAIEEVGTSRWFNAVGVVATPEQAAEIEQLPYVARVQMIGGDMQLAAAGTVSDGEFEESNIAIGAPLADAQKTINTELTDQLIRMQGNLFREHGIDGTGIRIAVFDGGFPKVNTHVAFKHLRDNGQILKTWNFPNRKENVYGWNGHGTMTLSNIAGRNADGKDLGLATGAEFILARTEVEAEPFKEEVWWMQAMEWADKNGANLISSSLGYGKDRHYTRDMNGKSYVARAANMAARKGMLVVNSAGNEGDDSHWQFIITPADADSALCIGGIENSLKSYEHISFSSFGPTADGRQKPNVCAFAHTQAASPHGGADRYEMVYGTSFSCPLVAGFAACAWQVMKGKTASEMFNLIQQSADLYPYCDYAFGYGVPQASFFFGQKPAATPTFRFFSDDINQVSVIPLRNDSIAHIFYKDVDENGRIIKYGKKTINILDTAMSIDFEGGHHLVVHYGGYTADYRFVSPSDPGKTWGSVRSNRKIEYYTYDVIERNPPTDKADEDFVEWDYYVMIGTSFATAGNELKCNVWSPSARIGLRGQYHFSKAYGIGIGIEYGYSSFRFNRKDQTPNALENAIGMGATITNADKLYERMACLDQYSIELFQRIRFVPGGSISHKGLHWDLGGWFSCAPNTYRIGYHNPAENYTGMHYEQLYSVTPLKNLMWNYGVTTRLTYDWIGVYGRYRLNGIGQDAPAGQITLPRLEVGIQLMF